MEGDDDDLSWSAFAGSRGPAAGGAAVVAAGPRYLEGAELGRGGMGRVRSVHDVQLGRSVARKELLPGSDPSALLREARVTAALEHPGIVPVHDAGVGPDGRPWYTMRIARGASLAQAIADAPDPRARLRLVRRLLAACEAVAYAHDRGVVHRDLKPSNILLGDFGETLVCDWGLALTREDADDGQVVGTPAWRSPEQAAGARATPRSDVWSLGAILHALVTGHPPSGPSQPGATAPNGAADFAGAPPELVAVARVALAADPADRYAESGALAAELARWLEGRRVEAHTYTAAELLERLLRAWRRPLQVAAVALVVLLVGVGTAWRGTALERARAVAATDVATEALARSNAHLARLLREQGQAALAAGNMPEAALLAAASLELAESPEGRGLLAGAWAAPLPTLTHRVALPGCERVALDPEAGSVACAAAGKVSLWTPDGRQWEVASEAARLAAAGGRVFVGNGNGVTVLHATSGATLHRIEGLSSVWPLHARAGHLWASSPLAPLQEASVGGHAATERWPCGPIGVSVHAEGPAGAAASLCDDGRLLVGGAVHPTPLADTLGRGTVLVWSPDGSRLAAGTPEGEVLMIDAATGAIGGTLVTGTGGVRALAFAPGTTVLALATERAGVALWDFNSGAEVGRLPAGDVADLRFVDAGILETAGRSLDRWALGEPAPWRFPAAAGVSAVEVGPAGDVVGSAHGDGTLRVRQLPSGAELRLRWQDRVAKDLLLLDAEAIGVGMGHPAPRRFRRSDGAVLGDLPWPRSTPIRRVERLGRGVVALSYVAGGPWIWSSPDTLQAPLDLDLGESWDAAGDPGGSVVIVAGERGVYLLRPGDSVGVEQVHAGGEARAVDVGARGLLAIVFPEGLRVGAAGALRAMESVDDILLDVALSPDGLRVAAAGNSGVTWVWSTGAGKLLGALRGHSGRVGAVEFSPTAPLLVTGGWDGAVRLWQLDALELPVAGLGARLEERFGLTLSSLGSSAVP